MAKFWIVMAVYRPYEVFLERQLQSLEAQTLTDWQCILVDDSGDPSEQDRISHYIQRDDRYVYHRHDQRRGSVKAFETGLKATPVDADYVCYCDQDDEWEPNKLMVMAAYFRTHDVALVHSDLSSIDAQGNEISPSVFQSEGRYLDHRLQYLAVKNVATGCASAFRHRLLDYILPFPSLGSKPKYHHDLWTVLHASIQGGIGVIEAPLVRYRQHDANQVGQKYCPTFYRLPINMLPHPIRFVQRSLRRWRVHAGIISDFVTAASSRCQTDRIEIAEIDQWVHARLPPHSMRQLAKEMAARRDPAMIVMHQLLIGKALACAKCLEDCVDRG